MLIQLLFSLLLSLSLTFYFYHIKDDRAYKRWHTGKANDPNCSSIRTPPHYLGQDNRPSSDDHRHNCDDRDLNQHDDHRDYHNDDNNLAVTRGIIAVMSSDRRSYDSSGHHLDRPDSTNSGTKNTKITKTTTTTSSSNNQDLCPRSSKVSLQVGVVAVSIYFHVSADPVCLHFAPFCFHCAALFFFPPVPYILLHHSICMAWNHFLCRSDVSWYVGTQAGAGGPRAGHQSCISRSGSSSALAKALPRSVTNAFLIAGPRSQATQPTSQHFAGNNFWKTKKMKTPNLEKLELRNHSFVLILKTFVPVHS